MKKLIVNIFCDKREEVKAEENYINQYSFRAHNDDCNDRILAILPAYYNTECLFVFKNKVIRRFDSPAEIAKAGYACHAVIDDCQEERIEGYSYSRVKCKAINPAFTIRAFRQWLKVDARIMTRFIIKQENGNNIYRQRLRVIAASAVREVAEEYINLSKYIEYDKSGKEIGISCSCNMLVDGETLLLLPVPAGAIINITYQFSNWRRL